MRKNVQRLGRHSRRGEALDDNLRKIASAEVEQFRIELQARRGGQLSADDITDHALLREVMNTVGKKDRLGEQIRCVVSVAMLTEGWDANTVTHVLGVRAFGTQLLCEQVIGRALRRQSYELNDEGLFDVEYADLLGIPFDFTAKSVITKPQAVKPTVQVKAISPERDALEIRFPRLDGYVVKLPEERLAADFTADHTLEPAPALVGPSQTRNEGSIGEGVDLNLVHTGALRQSALLFNLTHRLLYTHWRDANGAPKLHLFGQLKAITRQWLDNLGHLRQQLGSRVLSRGRKTSARARLREEPQPGLRSPVSPRRRITPLSPRFHCVGGRRSRCR